MQLMQGPSVNSHPLQILHQILHLSVHHILNIQSILVHLSHYQLQLFEHLSSWYLQQAQGETKLLSCARRFDCSPFGP